MTLALLRAALAGHAQGHDPDLPPLGLPDDLLPPYLARVLRAAGQMKAVVADQDQPGVGDAHSHASKRRDELRHVSTIEERADKENYRFTGESGQKGRMVDTRPDDGDLCRCN